MPTLVHSVTVKDFQEIFLHLTDSADLKQVFYKYIIMLKELDLLSWTIDWSVLEVLNKL